MAGPGIEKNALVGLMLSSVLAVAMIWIVGATQERLLRNKEQIIHSIAVIDVAGSLMEHLLNVEMGERGYIITGDDAYLVPHERGLAEVYVLHDKLVHLLADSPSEQSRLAELMGTRRETRC